MINKSVICPACGSGDVMRHEKESVGQLTLGSEFHFNEIYYHCNTCSKEGDFFCETDNYYLTAQKNAQAILVKAMLEDMNKAGISMAMFERVFELPARTMTRWKTGDFSASVLALLRLATTYPWIIGVAERKFERKQADYALINAALNEFMQEANQALPSQSNALKMGATTKTLRDR